MRIALPTSIALLFFTSTLLPLVPAAQAGDDAGTGADAGDSFATATSVAPDRRYYGGFHTGSDEDWYKFFVPRGQSINIEISAGFFTGGPQANDGLQRLGVRLYDPLGVLLDTPNSNGADSRLTWTAAHIEGEYRLLLAGASLNVASYSFCFVVTRTTCAEVQLQPIGTGPPLPYTHAEILLVPPMHSNPFGSETVVDYIEATMSGIHQWPEAIATFTTKYPEYSYLRELTVHVEVFDGVTPQRAGYDVIVVWAPSGPAFRGLAVNPFGLGVLHLAMCGAPMGPNGDSCAAFYSLEPVLHFSGRLIVMSSIATAPRGGQIVADFPEFNDVYNVAMHEFAHTWGLGHTQTYTAAHGPDLMNSPYMDVFGDGHPLWDGGERTPAYCISSLDLYGLAMLYEWVGRGVRAHQRIVPPGGAVALPPSMPYELFCP